MAISTGWTYDYVCWNVDLPRLATLNKYWKKFPPVHVLFTHFVGYKEPEVLKVAETEQKQEQDNFLANVPKYVFKPPVKVNNEHEPRP